MHIRIDLPGQRLELFDSLGACRASYPVSTALKGPGELRNSECTPRGRHLVRARIGAGLPAGAVLRGRRPTGELWSPQLARAHPGRDWILSRILWLSGCEPGRNRLGEVDSMRRYIYIHGTPDDQPMGEPRSHGCVRMRSADVIALFEQVPVGTTVDLVEHSADASPIAPQLLQGAWHVLRERVLPLRIDVFVVEQGVPAELEEDERDPHCLHLGLCSAGGEVLATARLDPRGHIGRVAVARAWRGRGLGQRIMRLAIACAHAEGHAEVDLHAQRQAEDFYRALGFIAAGEAFWEAGIEHIAMRRRLLPDGSVCAALNDGDGSGRKD